MNMFFITIDGGLSWGHFRQTEPRGCVKLDGETVYFGENERDAAMFAAELAARIKRSVRDKETLPDTCYLKEERNDPH